MRNGRRNSKAAGSIRRSALGRLQPFAGSSTSGRNGWIPDIRRGSVRGLRPLAAWVCPENDHLPDKSGSQQDQLLGCPGILSGNCSPAWLPISFLFPIHLIAGGVRQFSDLVGYRRACRAGCPDSSGRNFARLSMDSARGEWAAALARAALQRDPGRSAVAVRAVLAHHRHGSCRRQPLSHDDNGGHAGTRGAMKSRRRQCDVAIE